MSATSRQPESNPVRWWMTVLVFLSVLWITGGLTCLGIGQQLQAQTTRLAADSTTLRRLAEFHASGNMDVAICLAAHRDSAGTVIIDSITGFVEGPPCPLGTAGLAGVAAPNIPSEIAAGISEMLLAEYPDFLVACALVGHRYFDYPDGNRLFVPVLTCAIRSPS